MAICAASGPVACEARIPRFFCSRIGRREGGRRWLGRVLTAALGWGLFLLGMPPARALINPHYTPVELVNQSEVILRLEVGLPDEQGNLPVKVQRTLQGQPPSALRLRLDIEKSGLRERFMKAVGAAGSGPALLFSGDFSGAAPEGPSQDRPPVGMLHVGTTWFALFALGEGNLQVGEDPLDMKAVWAGSNQMLARIVEYVQADPRADVPTVSGVRWAEGIELGTLSGKVHGCVALELFAAGPPCLLVLCESGDRLFRPAAAGQSMTDVTAAVGLATRSQCATAVDANGDGRLDLALADEEKLSLLIQDETGRFAPLAAGEGQIALPGKCLSLSAINLGAPLGAQASGQAAALLAGTERGAVLVRFAADAKPRLEVLSPAGSPAGATIGPCAVADFDGDGGCDVIEPREDGLYLRRAVVPTGFAPPQHVLRVAFREKLTTLLAGDFDADGLPDLVLGGAQGATVLGNQGEGRFAGVLHEAGEVEYNSATKIIRGGALCDLNNDGREEFCLFVAAGGPDVYFNRGFCCFGYAADLEQSLQALPQANAATAGQQAGAMADFTGDGAVDLALVDNNGRLWLLVREGPGLGLTVSLPSAEMGLRQVLGFDGPRPLGCRIAGPGQPAFFGKRNKGPLVIKWHAAAGNEQTKQLIVLGPVRFVLPPDGS